MPRVHHVKKARKNNPAVKKGESYYWWKFMVGGRGGPKIYSKKRPRPSHLTSSDKLSRILAAQEEVEDAVGNAGSDSLCDLGAALENAASEVREVGEEYRESAEAIRESFSESETADQCEEKSEQCDSIADELETALSEVTEHESEIDEFQSELEKLDQEDESDDNQDKIDSLEGEIEQAFQSAVDLCEIDFSVG